MFQRILVVLGEDVQSQHNCISMTLRVPPKPADSEIRNQLERLLALSPN